MVRGQVWSSGQGAAGAWCLAGVPLESRLPVESRLGWAEILQRLGLESAGVWHTAYGDHPIRLLAFVGDEKEMGAALDDDRWKQVETRLKQYVTDYTRRIVPNETGFQF